MKKILLKHKIPPETLSPLWKERLGGYLDSAKDGKLSEFQAFLDRYARSIERLEASAEKLRQGLLGVALSLETALKSALSAPEEAVLSFFQRKNSQEDRRRFESLIPSLDAARKNLNAAGLELAACAAIPKADGLTELRLRKVALDEYGISNLSKDYAELTSKAVIRFFDLYESVLKELSELSKALNRLIEDGIKACGSMLADNNEIQNAERSLRATAGAVHSLISKIKELERCPMNKYRYVLFDLDGTLTDSAEGIIRSLQYALSKFGISVGDPDSLRVFLGPPLVDAFMKYFNFSEEDAHKATAYYRERFSTVGLFENRVYDGVTELLQALKARGFKMIIATSKPEEFTERILAHFNLRGYFDHVAGATFDGRISTKSQVIDYAFQKAGIDNPAEAIMIGDRHHDINGANSKGMDSIGVLYGYGTRDELESAGATYTAAAPEDILKILTK